MARAADAMLGVEFEVHELPELAEHVRRTGIVSRWVFALLVLCDGRIERPAPPKFPAGSRGWRERIPCRFSGRAV
jgi:hypothetical protein